MSGSGWSSAIKEVGRGARGARDLAASDAERLFGAMLDGNVPDLELGALWIAYRIKGESQQELAGFFRALVARMPVLQPPSGSPRPVLLPSYNGARRLPNLTPLLALLLARKGVPVVVHGLEEDYGRITSAAIFRALGMGACATIDETAQHLQGERLAYVPLGVLSPGLARLMQLRARIGVRSSAHTVAKLLDPFAGKALRVVPVTHPDYLQRMAELLAADGTPAVLMRGTEGEPYAHPKRMPALQAFGNGSSRELEPQGEHEEASPVLPGIDAEATANWMRAVLENLHRAPASLLRQVERLSAAAREQC